jgi:hypothetical protein
MAATGIGSDFESGALQTSGAGLSEDAEDERRTALRSKLVNQREAAFHQKNLQSKGKEQSRKRINKKEASSSSREGATMECENKKQELEELLEFKDRPDQKRRKMLLPEQNNLYVSISSSSCIPSDEILHKPLVFHRVDPLEETDRVRAWCAEIMTAGAEDADESDRKAVQRAFRYTPKPNMNNDDVLERCAKIYAWGVAGLRGKPERYHDESQAVIRALRRGDDWKAACRASGRKWW